MPEKQSSFEKVVGDASEQGKEMILKHFGVVFNDQQFEELQGLEREKTPKELQIIALANEKTNELRRRYGLEDFDIPAKNIHIVEKEKWPKFREERGNFAFFSPFHQGVAMEEAQFDVSFARTTLHELIHFKSYGSIQIRSVSERDKALQEYRGGLIVRRRSDGKPFYGHLNEGLTEELAKRILFGLQNHPLLKEERRAMTKISHEHRDAVDARGRPLFTPDTFAVKITGKEGNKTQLYAEEFTYPQERRMLDTLINKIYERNKDKFEHRDDVFDLLARFMFTGKAPIGKVIDTTFGPGTFKKIGTLEENLNEQEQFIRSL